MESWWLGNFFPRQPIHRTARSSASFKLYAASRVHRPASGRPGQMAPRSRRTQPHPLRMPRVAPSLTKVLRSHSDPGPAWPQMPTDYLRFIGPASGRPARRSTHCAGFNGPHRAGPAGEPISNTILGSTVPPGPARLINPLKDRPASTLRQVHLALAMMRAQ